MDKDTFYCSFVSIHYIICECGETFPSEESLKEHLEKEHNHKKEIKIIIPKSPPPDEKPANPANLLVYTDASQRSRKKPVYIIKKQPFIKNIKKETCEELPVEEATTPEQHLYLKPPQEIKTEFICESPIEEAEDVQEDGSYETPDEVHDAEGLQQDSSDQEQETAMETILAGHLEAEHCYDGIQIKIEEFYCEVCGKAFTSERSVARHMARVHLRAPLERAPAAPPSKKKTVCEVCGKKYASNAALRYHQRVHTGERPYHCTECPKSFTMPLFLQIHLRTHTGERPYECPHCPKAFSNKAALLRHDRVHTGVKPYACPECHKTFTQSNSMKLHVNTVHLKLPAPYKSRARRLRALQRRALADAAPQQVELYEVGSELQYEEVHQDEA